ncbi:LPXTG cell wall anchor domain-containing protein [Streptacidiphilus jiangxiensis]|uniref:LPXTG-motif cell wall anchor domain-containing protein n=1 Tax=Streptacidiphilus jiangxiensis TaxID=235985 RepID=A0A1H7RP12_STRJI|nr:LPXTG cell wall anchor domain-containing protein [Streptacidiphilus jiangxiensis]SEL61905.1 LPXTG-motif cell wall anchor domain-containing protein [Streptacidiphilus jiangxiensis]
MARGHRRKANGIRIAGIALALAGAGLSVAGVASAKVVDGPNDNQNVLPSDTPGVSVSVGLVGGDSGSGGDSGNGGDSGSSGAPSDSATPTQSTAPTQGTAPTQSSTASATASAGPTGGATASAAPSTGGTGGTGGGAGGVAMTQAPARTQLAETGSSENTPMILAGGLTFVLGGLVFRFGPRAASSRKH